MSIVLENIGTSKESREIKNIYKHKVNFILTDITKRVKPHYYIT